MEMIERDIWCSRVAGDPATSDPACRNANLRGSIDDSANAVNNILSRILKELRFLFHVVFIEMDRQVTVLSGADMWAGTHWVEAERADRPPR